MKHRLKRLLYLLLSRFSTHIRGGPLKGARWTTFCGIRFIRWDYEAKNARTIVENLKPGDVFWDIGAHVGYFTVIASRAVGPSGKVVSLEPSPVNLAYLRRNVALHKAQNVEIIPIAAGSAKEVRRMDTTTGRGTHHLDEEGDTEVSCDSVDGLIASGKPAPTFVKIDVEGFEESVLAGMAQTLAESKPLLLLAVHSSEIEARTLSTLHGYGYSLLARVSESKGGGDLLYSPCTARP